MNHLSIEKRTAKRTTGREYAEYAVVVVRNAEVVETLAKHEDYNEALITLNCYTPIKDSL